MGSYLDELDSCRGLVNGLPVIDDGKYTNALVGQTVRHSSAPR
jgi:hypothetical protein